MKTVTTHSARYENMFFIKFHKKCILIFILGFFYLYTLVIIYSKDKSRLFFKFMVIIGKNVTMFFMNFYKKIFMFY